MVFTERARMRLTMSVNRRKLLWLFYVGTVKVILRWWWIYAGVILYMMRILGVRTNFTEKKENKIFLIYCIRKFRRDNLQSHLWLTASSYMRKYLLISSYIRKPFLIYDLATAPLWISFFMRKIWFPFLSVRSKNLKLVLLNRTVRFCRPLCCVDRYQPAGATVHRDICERESR